MNADTHESTFTYAEITRQQAGWRRALEILHQNRPQQQELLERFRERVWLFTGCGTSYYLAQTASSLFTMLTGFRAGAIPASEILLFPEVVFNPHESYLLIPMSRSGATTEVVRAVQTARQRFQIPALAVSCDPQSPISEESDWNLTFPFEAERSVVMTGSFTSMLLSVVHLAGTLEDNFRFQEALTGIADHSQQIMESREKQIKEIVGEHSLDSFVFLGQGPFLGLANEAALKMQEMTLSVAHSYHSLEYRHGPMSTANRETLITLLFDQNNHDLQIQLVGDLKKLGARILVMGGSDREKICPDADFQITVPPQFGNIFSPFLYMPLLQLLAYYKAIDKNINPDRPKNLTAVVKLEL